MSNKQFRTLIAVIIAVGAAIILVPMYQGDKKIAEQKERDDSIDCSLYRTPVAVNNLAELNGKRVDWAATERKRRAGGCTPKN